MKKPNPDLFFNRATILEYLERYQEAINDYNTAHLIDPNLHADAKANRIIDFVCSTSRSILNKQNTKIKKITEMVKTVADHIEGELRFPATEEANRDK